MVSWTLRVERLTNRTPSRLFGRATDFLSADGVMRSDCAAAENVTVTSLHDRISGHAGGVRALDRFLTYAKSKGDVWFARKDEIARHVLANRAGRPVIDRGPPSRTGLPGPTA